MKQLIATSRMACLVALSLVVLLALFLVSFAVYAPVAALLMAPLALGAGAVFESLPVATLNSAFALVSGAWLAAATVMAVIRVLMRRARARQRAGRSVSV